MRHVCTHLENTHVHSLVLFRFRVQGEVIIDLPDGLGLKRDSLSDGLAPGAAAASNQLIKGRVEGMNSNITEHCTQYHSSVRSIWIQVGVCS